MFFSPLPLRVRPATPADRHLVMMLTRFERRVHSHLDWRSVEDWLGAQPFLLAEQGKRIVGALACPPDPPDTAWVRLFAASDDVSAEAVWRLLWGEARRLLMAMGVQNAAGLSTGDWMTPLYQSTGFQQTHEVIVLARPRGPLAPAPRAPVRIRLACPDDYPALIAVDQAAFSPPWQLSPAMIETAIAQANLITVAEADGHLVGYQLTTAGQGSAHLARLAVLPAWQGRGIGTALAADLIKHYEARGAHELTVNTQNTNLASLKVYQRLGFCPNGMRFPVFQMTLG